MKYNDFLNELKGIVQGQIENIVPEEEYYRKLLYQVELHSTEKPTAELLLKIFKDSLDSEPVEFDTNWNNLTEPEPFPDFQKMSAEDELILTKNTIKFFVSDLRRLGTKVLQDPHRGLGVTSSIGSRWYNFDICSIVYAYDSFCEDSLVISSDVEESNDNSDYSWGEISSILVFGKEYE
ncbi:hypothetical protein [Aquimarina mytili]|uniref:Uncharacterized protein n=1 Tax=Aquimarina mytili TaxID=874423 RepID=A0A937A4Y3_9FLAO|nr:hypothetical protein [Aquimarina mytili]MBL0684424.1 hypothetical protein [Aquimarina mytili]